MPPESAQNSQQRFQRVWFPVRFCHLSANTTSTCYRCRSHISGGWRRGLRVGCDDFHGNRRPRLSWTGCTRPLPIRCWVAGVLTWGKACTENQRCPHIEAWFAYSPGVGRVALWDFASFPPGVRQSSGNGRSMVRGSAWQSTVGCAWGPVPRVSAHLTCWSANRRCNCRSGTSLWLGPGLCPPRRTGSMGKPGPRRCLARQQPNVPGGTRSRPWKASKPRSPPCLQSCRASAGSSQLLLPAWLARQSVVRSEGEQH